MANRYWVGGTAHWEGSALLKWATTSGGIGGAAEPTSSDDVFFDANSGSVTVTIDTGLRRTKSLDFTGFTGTFTDDGSAGANLQINGNLILGAGMTIVAASVIPYNMLASGNVTSNGIHIPYYFQMPTTAGITVTLLDDLSCDHLYLANGTFDANGFNVTIQNYLGNSNTRVLNMGSGLWTLTGTGTVWDASPANLTVNPSTSTIKITSSGSSTLFKGNGKTYNNIWIAQGGNGNCDLTGSNIFNNFKVDPKTIVRFTAGTTTTVATMDIVGTSGNNIVLSSITSATHTISCPSGVISGDYLTISYSIASGGATFNAGANSTDNGNNIGWFFGSITPVFSQRFISHQAINRASTY